MESLLNLQQVYSLTATDLETSGMLLVYFNDDTLVVMYWLVSGQCADLLVSKQHADWLFNS